jgi:hypothetical protein
MTNIRYILNVATIIIKNAIVTDTTKHAIPVFLGIYLPVDAAARPRRHPRHQFHILSRPQVFIYHI